MVSTVRHFVDTEDILRKGPLSEQRRFEEWLKGLFKYLNTFKTFILPFVTIATIANELSLNQMLQILESATVDWYHSSLCCYVVCTWFIGIKAYIKNVPYVKNNSQLTVMVSTVRDFVETDDVLRRSSPSRDVSRSGDAFEEREKGRGEGEWES